MTSNNIERYTIQLACDGERKAQEMVFKQNANIVFKTLLRYTAGNKSSAEDLMQEVFIKVFRNLGKLDNPESLRPWIIKIARNTGLDFVRSIKKEKTSIFEYSVHVKLHQPDDQDINSRLLDMVIKDIEYEPNENVKETANKFYRAGLSISEIASAQGISETAVTSRLSRFRVRLKKRVLQKVLEEKT
jgi:RNA polymerase sigma-70 factor, ECF subfamily